MVHVRWLLPSLGPHFHGCFNWRRAQRCLWKSERSNKQHPLSGTLTFQTAVLVPWQQFIKLQCILGGTNCVSALQVWRETKRRVVGKSSLFPMPGSCSTSSLPILCIFHLYRVPWSIATQPIKLLLFTKNGYIHPWLLVNSSRPSIWGKKLHWKLIYRWCLLFSFFLPWDSLLSALFSVFSAHINAVSILHRGSCVELKCFQEFFFTWKSTWSSNFMLWSIRLII